MGFKFISAFLLLFLFISCNTEKRPREVVLYENYCASCHLAPNIQDLPKDIWKHSILPDMAARMGVETEGYHPYMNLSFPEQLAIIKTGIYPSKAIIDIEDWNLLRDYIIKMAPDSSKSTSNENKSIPITKFKLTPVSLDSAFGSLYTFLKIDTLNKSIIAGTRKGELTSYNFADNKNTHIGYFNRAITDARVLDDSVFVTTMGSLTPSEIPMGKTILKLKNSSATLADSLHRPVHTLYKDLNGNGNEEIIISEFGDLVGKLSLYEKNNFGFYKGRIILNIPGCTRTISRDMNNDGKEDLVVLAGQGDESIYILYQKENLEFTVDKVIRFSPVYGSSWFELVDYNADGYQDIITVNGDNADKSFVNKPFHGMRIHINDGNNNFEETYFYPLNGATRVVANDFDQDGDLDFALLATFPDYENHPEYNFVYLENVNSGNYVFNQEHLADIKMARWFLMDAADIDGDGDQDIVLSALTYSFTPVPEYLEKAWSKSYTDLLILENKLH
ncbi:FG-GAP repeat domain-containing protein [Maribacter hydrothermalis]|uniref:Repeat domain-containing protein n=1 Tax=Maribacter hydrothermalis TaxID=1836467 RepID=A0A1B7Z8K4_9FLAO|nr:VCBS repeat-containing protein [Maribacter hydrothermalis]OBR39022.1 hypothetical protein A9200_04995 [Maribacter hydrothermalis]